MIPNTLALHIYGFHIGGWLNPSMWSPPQWRADYTTPFYIYPRTLVSAGMGGSVRGLGTNPPHTEGLTSHS